MIILIYILLKGDLYGRFEVIWVKIIKLDFLFKFYKFINFILNNKIFLLKNKGKFSLFVKYYLKKVYIYM